MAVERKDQTTIILVPDTDAQFYLDRLFKLNDLESSLNMEPLPFKYWGEVPMDQDGSLHGLRWGLSHAILGSISVLDEMGYGLEARAIVGFKDGSRD